jgi:SAM-dependent methyltransferase
MNKTRKNNAAKGENISLPGPPKVQNLVKNTRQKKSSAGENMNTSPAVKPVISTKNITKTQPITTVTRDQVVAIYLALLGREPETEEAIAYHMRQHLNLEAFTEFVFSTPASAEYLSAKIGPETAKGVVAKGAILGDYSFFFYLMKKYFPVWHSSYLIVLALFQFINHNNREELAQRFIEAAEHNDISYLVTGENISLSHKPSRFQLPVCVLERYQDVRVGAVTYASGVRGCEERYQFIRSVASQFQRQFSVLDLGANLGYFAIRLIEEFDCIVVCCEGTYANWLRAIASKAARNRIVVLSKTMTIEDLERMSECESFDLVLAMSVVHHVGAPVARTIAALRNMAWKLIVELPTEQTACGPDRVKEALAYDWVADGGQLLGHSFSHLPGEARPTILLEGWADVHERAYMFSPRPCGVKIQRDWHHASVVKNDNIQAYVPAINLHTYLCLNGVWPVPVEAWAEDLALLASQRHGDVMPWNFLIHTGGLKPIDFHTDQDNFFNPDGLGRGLVEDIVRWASYKPDVAANTEIQLTLPDDTGEIVSYGFMQTSAGVIRPTGSNAILVLHHEFEPGLGLSVELSIRHSPYISIVAYGNDIECALSRDSSNPDYERLKINVPSDISLRNYPLLLRFDFNHIDADGGELPDFYSICYQLDGLLNLLS